MSKPRSSRWWWLIVPLGVLAIVTTWLLQPLEQYRIEHPNGQYVAVVSSPRYWSYLPTMPGQASDKPGCIEIFDPQGLSYGRIPLGMIQYGYELQWTDLGAKLKLIGDWDFAQREVSYWNSAQTKRIVKHVSD